MQNKMIWESIHAQKDFYRYHVPVARIVGINEAILIGYIIWRQFGPKDEVELTNVEIETGTALSIDQIRGVRKTLKELGILSERLQRLQHKTFYILNTEKLDELLLKSGSDKNSSPEREIPVPEYGKVAHRSTENPISSNSTELSTEQEVPASNGKFPEPPKGDMKPKLPVEMEFWNANCGILPKVLNATASRLQKLRTRRKSEFFCDNFQSAVVKCAATPFCLGENDRGWKADFDFLMQENTVTKIMEGAYENDRREKQNNGKHENPQANNPRPTQRSIVEERNREIPGSDAITAAVKAGDGNRPKPWDQKL